MRRVIYAAPVSWERKKYESDVFIEELLLRLKLMAGAYVGDVTGTQYADVLRKAYGIVGTFNPANGGSDLLVNISANVNALQVDINAGMAVFLTGEIIILPTTLPNIPIVADNGSTNVCYLEFTEETDSPVLTRYNTNVDSEVIYPKDLTSYVKFMPLTDYEALTSDQLLTKIPLSVVTLNSSGTAATADYTRTVLTTNRPWFSAQDVEHRSWLGSGTVTTNNAHGLSLNDIVAGDKTLFQLLANYGMVVAKDLAISHVPGHICTVDVPSNAVLQDTTGEVTGVNNAWYFYLDKYPEILLRTTIKTADVTDPLNEVVDVGAALVPKRNLVLILDSDQIIDPSTSEPYDLHVTYMSVDALAPPTGTQITSPITFTTACAGGTTCILPGSAAEETILAGGLVQTSPAYAIDMGDAGPFPSLYRIFMHSDGFLYKNPQCVYCSTKLSDMGTTVKATTINNLGPGKLRVGLTDAISPGLSVKVKLVGTSIDGSTISETVIFDSSTENEWTQDISPGEWKETAIIDSKIYRYTAQTFYSLTSVQVTENIAAGAQATIAVWMVLDDLHPDVTDMIPVADLIWDGSRVSIDNEVSKKSKIEDIRPVNTKLEPPRTTRFIDGLRAYAQQTRWVDLQGGSEVIVTDPFYVHQMIVEDFSKPRYVASKWQQASPVFNLADTDEVPPYNVTKIAKQNQALNRRDFYVSRPLPVTPHNGAVAKRLRITPFSHGPMNRDAIGLPGFSIWMRVYTTTDGWSAWTYKRNAASTLVDPEMTFDLDLIRMANGIYSATSATNKLLKMQFCIEGAVRGLGVVVLLDQAPSGPYLVYDIGVWDVDAWS